MERGAGCMEKAHDYELKLENAYLRRTLAVAQAQFDSAAAGRQAHADALRETQEELLERGSMDVGGFGSAQGFQDMLDLSGDMMSLHESKLAQDELDLKILSLTRTLDSPYFARIDFVPEGGTARQVYIGRATLLDEASMQFYVYDWRTPIASVFYQYGVGPAQYEAPGGRITGRLEKKRQYEIHRGALQYFFDADTQVSDAFLRQMLAKPASMAMKDIVETIQMDQDRIIRDLKSRLLMVQGAAGSGKTSVALHRVAYLMYEGLRADRLAPEEMLVIAPNAAFERYIEQVLPGLGEQQVRTVLFEDLLRQLLPKTAIQPRGAWVEALLLSGDSRQRAQTRALRARQGSRAFIEFLDRLTAELTRRWIPFADIFYDGQCIRKADAMRMDIENGGKLAPLGIRLEMLEKQIWRDIHALRPKRMEALLEAAQNDPLHFTEATAYARMLSIAESGALLKEIRKFTRIDCALLYRALFADAAAFARLAKGLMDAREAEALREAVLEGLAGDTLSYGDAAAVAYVQAKVYGSRTYRRIRQLVVDEVQDMDALHIRLLGLLFPGAHYTMLGDMYQTLGHPPDQGLFEMIQSVLGGSNAVQMTLNKRFRSTKEISAFSMQFLPEGADGESFSRSGDPVRLLPAQNAAAMDVALCAEIAACVDQGDETIACLCKTEAAARALHARLSARMDIKLIVNDDLALVHGVAVLPLYMAKGLEFDAVMLCGADAASYRDEADKGLLYVGCTRALHHLALLWHGERSPLIREEQ